MNIIWIGGTGRCGTSILHKVLGHHPEVGAVPREVHFLTAPCGAFALVQQKLVFNGAILGDAVGAFQRAFDRIWDENKNTHCGDISQHVARFIGEFNEAKSRDELIAAARKLTYGTFSDAVARGGKKYGYVWLSEKTPRNLLMSPFILDAFPGSRFIHIKRDPRGVISSWSRQDWCPEKGNLRGTAGVLRDNWYTPWAKIRKSVMDHPHYYEVKLEDICDSPQHELTRIADFIGITPIDWGSLNNQFQFARMRQWFNEPEKVLLDQLGKEFDALMGYEWRGGECSQECA